MENKLNKKIILIGVVILILVFILCLINIFGQKEEHQVNQGNNYTQFYDKIEINTTETDNSRCSIISESLDKSLVFREDEIPLIGFSDSTGNVIGKQVNIKLYKINNSDDYIKVATGQLKVSDLTVVDNLESKIIKNAEDNRASYFEFGKTLEKGYYVAEYNIDEYCSNYYQLIQITNMSTYVGNTERDILIWTVDPATDQPINTTINFEGKDYNSDENGLIKIENLINTEEDKIFFIKINGNDNELLVAVKNFNSENYYTSFIYTDKPIYKTTDTINIWGFVPLNLFIDEIKDDFKIGLGENEYKVSPNNDGIFTLKIDIENFESNRETLKLIYNEQTIAEADITIENYVKPQIEYKIITDKNNYMLTDNIIVEVGAHSLTGEAVANKVLYVSFNNKQYSCTTNSNGICNVNIPLKNYVNKQANEYIINEYLYLTDTKESSDESIIAQINVVYKDTKIIANKKMVGNDNYHIELTSQKITVENDEIVYTNTTSKIQIVVEEQTGKAKYNILTKLYDDPVYETKNIKDYTITLQNGYQELTDLNYLATLEKGAEYAVTKNYTIYFKTTDSTGKEIEEIVEMPWLTIDNYYLVSGLNNDDFRKFTGFCTQYALEEGCLLYPILGYRNVNKYYSINEKINTKMYSNDITEKEEGTNLTYIFKEKIIDNYFDTNEISYKNEYFPGSYIGGAYYDSTDNYIYLAKKTYMDYRNEDRYVDIELATDKDKYTPNDTVTLNIKVTDKNEKGIKTNVLVSVVDEAIFLMGGDRADEIVSIYDDKYMPFYQYSTHLDLPFVPGGLGAARGSYPSKIGDTIYFENIETDENGIAKVTFKLNDLETKFRITSIAVNSDLYYGSNVKKIISKNN